MKKLFIIIALLIFAAVSCREVTDKKVTQAEEKLDIELLQAEIPDILHNIHYDENGKLYWSAENSDDRIYRTLDVQGISINSFDVVHQGTDSGVAFNFQNNKLNGTLYYGFIVSEKYEHPYPVFSKYYSEIKNGKAELNILENLNGKYDIAEWNEDSDAVLGYRVLNEEGKIYYDGKLYITGQGPFTVEMGITEGPFLHKVTDSSCAVSFRTNMPSICSVEINGKKYEDKEETKEHIYEILGLNANTEYDYQVNFGKFSETFRVRTFPEPGSRGKFTFAFTSDSRDGKGGGERDIRGTNAYIVKKMLALANGRNAKFMQFTGDMIDGYLSKNEEQQLQYTNFRRAIEPFAHEIPIFIGMGNHENQKIEFRNNEVRLAVDKFPYETHGAEFMFGRNVVNFENGPVSEDNSEYDPNPNKTDFPSYDENVYYYVHDNLAMIVLNSNYWYSPARREISMMGGNLHGYIMDNQLVWLEETMQTLEGDKNIDHIIVTFHTPVFPSSSHIKDAMWYLGENEFRPYVAGKPVKEGILERRNRLLDICINKSDKFIAFLTGDEHNYSRLRLNAETVIHPEGWDKEKFVPKREVWHIVNGSSGAPYYGQMEVPWTPMVEHFSTKYALCLFHVDGKNIELEVVDPDTMEEIERLKLR